MSLHFAHNNSISSSGEKTLDPTFYSIVGSGRSECPQPLYLLALATRSGMTLFMHGRRRSELLLAHSRAHISEGMLFTKFGSFGVIVDGSFSIPSLL
jgi:hypothetical protein